MNAANSRTLIQRWPGVLAALLATSLVAPSSAQASCGDYVVFGNHKGTTHAHAPMTGEQFPAPDHSSGKHLPCSGPNCSRRSLPPPVVPPPPAPSGSEVWGCLPANLLVANPDSDFRVNPAPGPRPLRRVVSIYHPPRASSAS